MQTLSSYLLEKSGIDSAQAESRKELFRRSVDRWLASKGVEDLGATQGQFESRTPDGGGTYTREAVVFGDEFAEEVILREKANSNQIFLTKVCFALSKGRAIAHATVSAASMSSTIFPQDTTSRCPSIIRDLIRASPDWTIGEAAVPTGRPRDYSGQDGGEDVCRIIGSTHRRFPLLLVSELDGEFIWDGLDRALAYDLVGLAYVSSIDDAAGDVIARRLGKRHACFDGAIRLYWPNLGTSTNHVQSTLWTAERILDVRPHVNAQERLRDQLRQKVMSAAALAITEPVEISDIHRASSRKKLAELHGNAAKVDEVYEIANSYADDLVRAKQHADELKTALAILTTRAENAEAQLSYLAKTNSSDVIDDIDISESSDEDSAQSSLTPGTVVYYKKVDAAPGYDIMVRRGDCGHNKWQSAHSADKAWKGVERLEGRNDWNSFLHCERCKGGGVWKVTW